MSTRHLFATAAMMAATFSAQADVIATTPDALASSSVIANATVASTALSSNMNIVDGGSSLNGTGLASILASSNSTAQLYLVRGVEGLYMLASRLTSEPDAIDTGAPAISTPDAPVVTAPVLVDAGTPAEVSPLPVAIDLPSVDAEGEVPEPSSIALMLAGLIGAAGFTRARKQG
jgi:hypothetical protein